MKTNSDAAGIARKRGVRILIPAQHGHLNATARGAWAHTRALHQDHTHHEGATIFVC